MSNKHTISYQVDYPRPAALLLCTTLWIMQKPTSPCQTPAHLMMLPAFENVLYKRKKKRTSYKHVHFEINVHHPVWSRCINSRLVWMNEHAWVHFMVRTFCSITVSTKKTILATSVISISPYSDIIAYICCPSVYLRVSVTAACWPVDCLWDSRRDADS